MWEYKVITLNSKSTLGGGSFDSQEIEIILNSYGNEGWELVNISSSNVIFGSTERLVAVFKRAKK